MLVAPEYSFGHACTELPTCAGASLCISELRYIGLLMAKNPIHSHPYLNLITLISIPHPTKNTRGKLNSTHPITLLIPNQPVIGWKPMENPWV
jgi:hypothetical protein